MSWSTKNKIRQDGGDDEIQTPDGITILVGSSEDEVLLWQIAFENWGLKTKIVAGAWANKAKIAAGSWSLKTKIEP